MAARSIKVKEIERIRISFDKEGRIVIGHAGLVRKLKELKKKRNARIRGYLTVGVESLPIGNVGPRLRGACPSPDDPPETLGTNCLCSPRLVQEVRSIELPKTRKKARRANKKVARRRKA